MIVELPARLRHALDAELSRVDARHLARGAVRLSERYREAPPGAGGGLVGGEEEALAYATWLMPATHAQVTCAIALSLPALDAFAPTSLLDLGAGPGTAAWAAAAAWPSLRLIVAVEREPAFVSLGRRLASASDHAAVRGIEWIRHDAERGGWPVGPFDVVIAAHFLGELAQEPRARVVARAFQASAGALFLAEPGTPRGFETVRAARDQLLACGASTLAPCPHDRACPLASGWCHFAQRAMRPEAQRRAKGASQPWEDAKVSFAVLGPAAGAARPWARVLHAPRHQKGRVTVPLCAAEGLVDRTVPRSAGAAYRVAKGLRWGSVVPSPRDLEASRE